MNGIEDGSHIDITTLDVYICPKCGTMKSGKEK
jgi:hypothetical protein